MTGWSSLCDTTKSFSNTTRGWELFSHQHMLTMLLRICFDSQPQLNLAAKRQRCWPLCQSICLKWYSRPSVIWPGGHDRCCSCDQDAKEFCFEKCSPCSKGVHKPDRVSNIDCNWNLWPRPRKENETLKSLETNDTIIHNHHYIYIHIEFIPWGLEVKGEEAKARWARRDVY